MVKDMKKILFFIHDLGQGGAEKVLVNLVNNMNPEKFDITVMSLLGGGVNEQFLKKEIKYKTVFSKSFPGNSHLMKFYTPEQLHRFFIKEKYDIEVAYLEGSASRIISGCPHKDTKLVSWVHVEQLTKEIVAKSYRSFSESLRCYQKFDEIVCVSESVKKNFLGWYPEFSNVRVLYNTNESDQILKLKDKPVEEGTFKEGEIRLCGVGKLMPNKGFDKLARIHKMLREQGYPVHTYLLGNGPEKERIENYISENKLEDTFTLLGYQTNPYKYLGKSDLFVCTSISEGFSTAATEALILGVPVVTTPVAGMHEMLGSNHEYGIIAEHQEQSIYESIKRLLDEPEMLKDYKNRALLRGKEFSTETTVKAVENMLESLYEG